MAMKLFALGVIALMDAALPAAAADRMPTKLVGNWCMDRTNQRQDDSWAFTRTTACLHGFWLKFRADGSLEGQDGTDGSRATCKLLQLIVIKPDDYLAKFRCNTEGQPSNTVYRLSLDRDRLVMTILD
jgi:hypothetical protein